MLKILISNDDGVNSAGIDVIAKNASELGQIQIIAPQSQQTASGKGLTFHKPIRLQNTSTVSGIPAQSYNTVPADSVIIYQHLFGKPDLVLSGLNAGENTSIHSILTSGTCAVAMESGMKNIPSFAFSIDTPEIYFHSNQIPGNIELAGKLSVRIAKLFLQEAPTSFWDEVIFVNINFPDNLSVDTDFILAKPETYKYNNSLYERQDPKGDNYFWLWGKRRTDFTPNADTNLVYDQKKITITPISFYNQERLNSISQDIIEKI